MNTRQRSGFAFSDGVADYAPPMVFYNVAIACLYVVVASTLALAFWAFIRRYSTSTAEPKRVRARATQWIKGSAIAGGAAFIGVIALSVLGELTYSGSPFSF